MTDRKCVLGLGICRWKREPSSEECLMCLMASISESVMQFIKQLSDLGVNDEYGSLRSLTSKENEIWMLIGGFGKWLKYYHPERVKEVKSIPRPAYDKGFIV